MDFISVFRLLISVGAAICVAEVIASVTWLPFYFRRGIQVYHRDIHGDLESTRELSDITACSNSGFRFRSVSNHEVMFRDPLIHFSFRATPVMHGLLSYDGSKFELLGLANWTPLSFGVLFMMFGILAIVETEFTALVMLAPFVALWMWSYQAQKRRLDDLVDEITANLKTNTPVMN